MALSDIKNLHFTASLTEFNENKKLIFYKWSQFKNIDFFAKFFIDQWINNEKTQIFLTPAGVASTNNPIESFIINS